MAVTALASLARIREENSRKKVLALSINSDFLVQLAKKIQFKKGRNYKCTLHFCAFLGIEEILITKPQTNRLSN